MNKFFFCLIFKKTCTSFTKTTNTIKDFYQIEANNEEALKEALVTIGPVAICLFVSFDTFYNYKSGIWDGYSTSGQKCSAKCEHAVVLMGIYFYFILFVWLIKSNWHIFFKVMALRTESNIIWSAIHGARVIFKFFFDKFKFIAFLISN